MLLFNVTDFRVPSGGTGFVSGHDDIIRFEV